MKRLIRKSKWYDSVKFRGNTFEIFKNPTNDEIREIKQSSKFNSIRGLISNGVVYAWDGALLHINMLGANIDINNGLHFACDESSRDYNGWTFDTTNLGMTLEGIYSLIQSNKNVLLPMGNLNFQIFIGKTTDNFGYDYTEDNEDNDQSMHGYFTFSNWAEMDEYIKNFVIAVKTNTKFNKIASLYQILDSFSLKSGDGISFNVKILANRPWFQIIHDHQFSSSSYYDGTDLERALEMYTELLLAFKGAAVAEKVKKSRGIYEKKIQKLVQEKKDFSNNQMYDSIKRKPLFLGNNDF